MIVTLIPLFLAASIGVKENDWKYGPEVIWDLKIESVSSPLGKMDGMARMKMYCRPKTNYSMICQLRYVNELKNASKMTAEIEAMRETDNDEFFELNFGDNAISGIFYPLGVDLKRLKLIASVVDGFGIQSNFSKETMNQSENSENWKSTGCRTDYIHSLNDTSENNDEMTKPYELLLLPEMKSLKGQIKDIKRRANLNNCFYAIEHIFSIWNNRRVTKPKLVSAHARLTIKEREYTSWIESTFMITTKLNPSHKTIVQTVMLSLADIIPARSPMPIINFPKIYHDMMDNITNSEEQNSSEENKDLN